MRKETNRRMWENKELYSVEKGKKLIKVGMERRNQVKT